MIITNDILKSCVYCKTKAYHYINNEVGAKSDYELLIDEQTLKIKNCFIDSKQTSKNKCIDLKGGLFDLSLLNYNYVFNPKFIIDKFHIQLDVIERTKIQNTDFYTPIIFSGNENITVDNKIYGTCISILLKKQIISTDYFKIAYGKNTKSSRINFTPYQKQAKNVLNFCRKINKETIYLNKKCITCEYKILCKEIVIEEDNLSLFSGISKKEILKWNQKGIFTINQLSYNFKPRRQRKKKPNTFNPHKYELRALSIRKKTIHVIDDISLNYSNIQIYLDIESLPDENFVYLIGLKTIENGIKTNYSFWANSKNEELIIFDRFLELVLKFDEYTIFHFGSYEIKYFKRIRKNLIPEKQLVIDKIIENSINLLQYFYSNIYLPTYSNSLKDIANFIGFKWSNENSTGVQSIVWRKKWENENNKECKEKLINYNLEDCEATLILKNFIESIVKNSFGKSLKVAKIQELPKFENDLFHNKNFALEELKEINKCSYFNYQRNKVFVRTDKFIKESVKNSNRKRKIHRVNQKIELTSTACPFCQTNNFRRTHNIKKNVIDLKFTNYGIKRWIIDYISYRYFCRNCEKSFAPKEYLDIRLKYGHNIMSWVTFQHFANNQSFAQISKNLYDYFGIYITNGVLHEFKEHIAQFYRETYLLLNQNILTSYSVYADETQFKLKDETGYVWVFTNIHEAVCHYESSREGVFLKEFLKEFKGILISDFYAPYDSIDCKQQKCLVHLIRDLDSDLLKNPFDEEYKGIVQDFTTLIQPIIRTIDKYGLKSYHLKKYIFKTHVFIAKIIDSQYKSEIAIKYQKRIEKNKDKLFTFLHFDNVSWNNTNAEHAIKLLATHRNKNISFFKTTRMEDYLIIMSIYMTCKYNGISFLQFLLSGKKSFN